MFLVLAVHVELSDTFNTELFFLKFDLVGVWGKFRGESSNLIRECGREENNLDGMITGKHACTVGR